MKICEVVDINDSFTEVRSQEEKLVSQFNELKSIVSRDCQPFLKDMGGIDNILFHKPLYRGIAVADYKRLRLGPNSPIKEISIRTDREPKDTPGEVSALIDNWLLEHTGIRFRSAGLFCTGRLFSATGYGVSVIVIPKGDYHYTWSINYKDMYEELGPFVDSYGDLSISDMWGAKKRIINFFGKPDAADRIDDFMKIGDYYFDSGLSNALSSGSEIMISCKEAIVVDTDWSSKLHFYLLHNDMPPSRPREEPF